VGRGLPNRSIQITPPGGDIRLLAPTARHASARVLLALAAIAALALAGCGGGGSGAEGATSASTQAQQASSSAPSESEGAQEKGASPSAKAEKAQHEAPGAPGGSPSAEGSGKHGKQIQLPEGSPEPTATPAEEAQATVADITLQSPDIGADSALPTTFTCDGSNTWPALRWQGVPAGTQELVLFAMNVAPVQGELFFDWSLAGLDPSLGELESAKLPKGAVAGQNSFGKTGYELCPPQGSAETYVFTLYALPQRLAAQKGFDPAELRRQVQGISKNAGILAATYGRG
jgi:phosphatidylethanolamine-binding protein (PEBP) family uncharacterized protein